MVGGNDGQGSRWGDNGDGKENADAVPADMRRELNSFDEEAERLIAAFIGTIETTPPPPIIYHYTNDAGLRGILESGKLWLTDIFSLNDPSELHHGFSHVVVTLKQMAENGPPESKVFADAMAGFLTHGGIREAAHYFVGSFSSVGDDLGQWRAYADNGRGYALGFDGRALEEAFTKHGEAPIQNNSTFPVIYNNRQLATLQQRLVERMFSLISLPRGRAIPPAARNNYMSDLYAFLSMHALRTALFFKHEAYSNEREFRFLQLFRADQAPEVKFRGRPYSLVKYREFDWRGIAPNALQQIVVGPAADFGEAAVFATDCMRAFHRNIIQPTRSEIPYRAS